MAAERRLKAGPTSAMLRGLREMELQLEAISTSSIISATKSKTPRNATSQKAQRLRSSYLAGKFDSEHANVKSVQCV